VDAPPIKFGQLVDQFKPFNKLPPPPYSRYSLGGLPAAFDHLGQRPFGKIVIDVAW